MTQTEQANLERAVQAAGGLMVDLLADMAMRHATGTKPLSPLEMILYNAISARASFLKFTDVEIT